MKLLEVKPSATKGKKYVAIFEVEGKQKKVSFGAKGMMDYIQYSAEDRVLAEERKRLYLIRHAYREDWDNPITPGALSKHLLWNKTTLEASIRDFKRRFHV
jgi:hypothetical protein